MDNSEKLALSKETLRSLDDEDLNNSFSCVSDECSGGICSGLLCIA